jgi:hypothetical protein
MRTSPLFIALLVLAGCGADEPTAGPKIEDAALKFAQCMRGQGIDFPDPRKDEDGGVQMGGPRVGEGVSRQKLDTAHKACEKHLRKIKRPDLSDEEMARVRKDSLRHARCMRENGIDFPDPQFSADGGVTVKIEPGSGIDPRSPKFQSAEKACAKELPRMGDRAVEERRP